MLTKNFCILMGVFLLSLVSRAQPIELKVIPAFTAPTEATSNLYTSKNSNVDTYEIRLEKYSTLSTKVSKVKADGCNVSQIQHRFDIVTVDEQGEILENITAISVNPGQSFAAYRYFRTRMTYVPTVPVACQNVEVQFVVFASPSSSFLTSSDGSFLGGFATSQFGSLVPVEFSVVSSVGQTLFTNRMRYGATFNKYDETWEIFANFSEVKEFGGFSKLSFSTDAEIKVAGSDIVARCFDDEERFMVIGHISEFEFSIDKNVSIYCKPLPEKIFVKRNLLGDLDITVESSANGLPLVGKAHLIKPD